VQDLINFRRYLHQHPELSGQEKGTSQKIIEFITPFNPIKIIRDIGGHGVAIVYEFSKEGSTIMIRCELDALPIEEKNNFYYCSKNQNVSHKCGHDGHMIILCGLAQKLQNCDFKSGKVVLLFQPAEENGQGAKAVLEDPRFHEIKPEYVFALHNLPGLPMHSIYQVKGQFTPTVQSLAIKLGGKTAHAAEPENGINPALAISELIQAFKKLEIPNPNDLDFKLITPIHISMGQKDYGLSAGKGELHFTIRCWSVEKMNNLVSECYAQLEKICNSHHLTYETDWFDYFPTVMNSDFCNQYISEAAKKMNLSIIHPTHGCKFGEDFGFFTQHYSGAMFGLGAGKKTSALHHDDYDFPDELIETGVDMFWGILKEMLD
jgi:amidohydrolase